MSKISTVKFFIYIFFFTLFSADIETAEGILLKSFHRMDGIDYRFKVTSMESGNKKKETHFEASIHWPSEGNILRQIRITAIESKRKKPSSFWEHHYKDGTKAKKWMSFPVTGKLKDVSDKKSGKKDFSILDLGLTKEDIRSHTHILLHQEKIDTLTAYVIESIEKSKKGKVKASKKLWIDSYSYMILKVEFYTGSGRLYQSVECADFHYINEILFPMSIYVQKLKSKTDIQITVTDIELNPEVSMNIFIPKDQ